MKKTATAAQVKEQFIMEIGMDAALERTRDALEKEWDIEQGTRLFLDILKQLSEQAAEEGVSLDSWTPLDKMAWAVKEAYIIGFLSGFEVTMKQNEMGYNALFGE